MIEFMEFAKIPRLRREICITEKIDGTNAAVQIRPMAEAQVASPMPLAEYPYTDQHGEAKGMYGIWAQSRSQFVLPGKKDNYGWGGWVQRNAEELITCLGEGIHYGEWWGNGIQRGYGQSTKRFSLFNVARWHAENPPPSICDVVPILYRGGLHDVQMVLESLRLNGSVAAPGWMKPEGIVVWHSQSKQYYKVLLEGDDMPKSKIA